MLSFCESVELMYDLDSASSLGSWTRHETPLFLRSCSPGASSCGSTFLTWQLPQCPGSVLWFGEVLHKVCSFSPSNVSVNYLDSILQCFVLKRATRWFCNVQLWSLSNMLRILWKDCPLFCDYTLPSLLVSKGLLFYEYILIEMIVLLNYFYLAK